MSGQGRHSLSLSCDSIWAKSLYQIVLGQDICLRLNLHTHPQLDIRILLAVCGRFRCNLVCRDWQCSAVEPPIIYSASYPNNEALQPSISYRNVCINTGESARWACKHGNSRRKGVRESLVDETASLAYISKPVRLFYP